MLQKMSKNEREEYDLKREYFQAIFDAMRMDEDEAGLPVLEVKWSGEGVHPLNA